MKRGGRSRGCTPLQNGSGMDAADFIGRGTSRWKTYDARAQSVHTISHRNENLSGNYRNTIIPHETRQTIENHSHVAIPSDVLRRSRESRASIKQPQPRDDRLHNARIHITRPLFSRVSRPRKPRLGRCPARARARTRRPLPS